ncbi:MAG: acyl--CoA ligase [Clostridiales bacterium]|nr:acyl--CoA ligase [Clostridiales bacterium]
MKYQSVVEAILDHAKRNPEKLCTADTQASYSYGEFAALIKATAAVLKIMGVGLGDCVVVEAAQRADFTAIEFGLHLLGAIFVPMEGRCSVGKMAGIAGQCGAKLLISSGKVEVPDSQSCTYAELKDRISGMEDGAEVDVRIPLGEEISEILFSTGTTGKEKGIVLTHNSAVAVAENIVCGSHMQSDNVEMIPSPLNHSHGLRSYYANMVCGGAAVLVDNLMNMRKFYEMMDQYQVNAMDLVPSALAVILKLSGKKLGEYRDRLNYIEFGSAPMAPSDKKQLMELLEGVPLYNYYGSTESGRASVYNFNRSDEKEGCIGRPTANTEIIITDPERRSICSDREHTGLLACKGAMNMLYYWEDPQETDLAMENGYIYTKDEGYVDEDGDIILIGRVGDIINIGGKKVSPDEIEDVVRQMPGIADCGCISVADAMSGNVPKLFVEMKPGCAFDAKAIRDYIGEHLEAFKIPRYFECIDKIPRTFNGKLQRKVLKAR